MTQVLLVMDVQRSVVERFAQGSGPTLAAVGRALEGARRADVAVVHVTVGFRPGAPEVSRRNRSFAVLAGSGALALDDPQTAVHPAAAPLPGEVVVVKKRVGAFSGSDLDVVLRAMEADTLVLSGIATSGVVLSTLRHAADLDFGLTVLSDACFDADPEVHRVLVDKVFPRQAAVVTVDEWLAGLGPATAAG